MKVVCINCINDNDGWCNLTIGKTYDVIHESEYGYVIIDDIGYKFLYSKEWFKLLSEIRNEKIDKLLEDES